ncbi:hypothetical protein J3R83DRAFT_10039 [Lanmaoa asiatica]|nr:hypothetical protein J3R83DRAFT_10039 [Lanmaoa asiatica]
MLLCTRAIREPYVKKLLFDRAIWVMTLVTLCVTGADVGRSPSQRSLRVATLTSGSLTCPGLSLQPLPV